MFTTIEKAILFIQALLESVCSLSQYFRKLQDLHFLTFISKGMKQCAVVSILCKMVSFPLCSSMPQSL